MTILKRRILASLFILLFLILAPVLVFYANGNILARDWNLLATGGIYMRSIISGSEVLINGKTKNISAFFNRDYFLKNLKPGYYTIHIKKEGYNDWTNQIKVIKNKVSETRVFMLPIEVGFTEIFEFVKNENTISTTTKAPKINPDYKTVLELFSAERKTERAISIFSTTTGKTTKYELGTLENPIKNGHFLLWQEAGKVFLSWNGNQDSSPKVFCDELAEKIKCQDKIEVFDFKETVNDLDFFPGETEIITVTVGDRLYAIEAQNNSDKKPQLLYQGKTPEFEILDNNIIYIKDSEKFYRLEV